MFSCPLTRALSSKGTGSAPSSLQVRASIPRKHALVLVLVIVVLDFVAIGRGETGAGKVQRAVHLVLVARQRVVADDLPRFEIAPAVEAAGIVDVAASIVDRGLRVGTDRAGTAGGRRLRAATGEQGLRRNAILDPVHQSSKRIDRDWAGAE